MRNTWSAQPWTKNAQTLETEEIEEVLTLSQTNANSRETSYSNSDACMGNDHSDSQATQNETSVTTQFRRTVKSTRDHENFVYY